MVQSTTTCSKTSHTVSTCTRGIGVQYISTRKRDTAAANAGTLPRRLGHLARTPDSVSPGVREVRHPIFYLCSVACIKSKKGQQKKKQASPPERNEGRPQARVIIDTHVIAHGQQSPVPPVEHSVQQRLPIGALNLPIGMKGALHGQTKPARLVSELRGEPNNAARHEKARTITVTTSVDNNYRERAREVHYALCVCVGGVVT